MPRSALHTASCCSSSCLAHMADADVRLCQLCGLCAESAGRSGQKDAALSGDRPQ